MDTLSSNSNEASSCADTEGQKTSPDNNDHLLPPEEV